MKDYIGYFTGSSSLEEREKLLFELIDTLDKEGFDTFGEILNLDENSYYKFEELVDKVNRLKELFVEINRGYEHIKKIEASGYDYAARRYQLKRLIISINTVFLVMINAILGILYYTLMYTIANKEFADELSSNNIRYQKFDDDRISLISNTLDNCERILMGKLNRAKNKDFDIDTILANDYIESNISERNEDFGYIDDIIKDKVVHILKEDLRKDSNNIDELLSLAKEKHNKTLKLIKKYDD